MTVERQKLSNKQHRWGWLLIFVAVTGVELAPRQAVARKDGPETRAVAFLAQRMRELPVRWTLIGPPRVAVSGRSIEAVLQAASEAERKAAGDGFVELYKSP